MPRQKVVLTDREASILNRIPAATTALLLWADLRRKTQAAKAQRTLFAHQSQSPACQAWSHGVVVSLAPRQQHPIRLGLRFDGTSPRLGLLTESRQTQHRSPPPSDGVS